MNIILPKRIPQNVAKKALEVLSQYECGEIRVKLIKRTRTRALNVGRDWRLLEVNNKWHLMSHEDYNKFLNRM